MSSYVYCFSIILSDLFKSTKNPILRRLISGVLTGGCGRLWTAVDGASGIDEEARLNQTQFEFLGTLLFIFSVFQINTENSYLIFIFAR